MRTFPIESYVHPKESNTNANDSRQSCEEDVKDDCPKKDIIQREVLQVNKAKEEITLDNNVRVVSTGLKIWGYAKTNPHWDPQKSEELTALSMLVKRTERTMRMENKAKTMPKRNIKGFIATQIFRHPLASDCSRVVWRARILEYKTTWVIKEPFFSTQETQFRLISFAHFLSSWKVFRLNSTSLFTSSVKIWC